MYEVVQASVVSQQVRKLGILMYTATVVTGNGRVLFQTGTFFSEEGARAEAYRWIQRQAQEANRHA